MAVAVLAGAAHAACWAETTESRLQAVAERRHEQAHAEREQGDDGEGSQEAVGEAERGDHVHERDGREREGERQAGDDAEWAAAAAGHAGGERDGEDREHAGGDGGGGSGDEREDDQDKHEAIVAGISCRSLTEAEAS